MLVRQHWVSGTPVRGAALKSAIQDWGSTVSQIKRKYTDKQGQYLAFIYYYSRLNGCAPSEADMQNYFRVTPPSVHQMVLTLEKRGLIERVPWMARSIRLLVPREELPDLK